MEKEQYRITHRLKTKDRYSALVKSADKNNRSINEEINTALDVYLALTKPSKKSTKSSNQ